MALSVSQIISASYNDVVNESRKPENQWAESAAMREMEKQGCIERIDGGPQIETTLDYKRNDGAEFQSTDLQDVSVAKTDVLTAALYDPAQLTVPIVWSRADEAKNPSKNQKVALVKSLLQNGLDSHDDVLESALFTADTTGFKGLPTIVPTNGQGTVGGIDAGTEVWWRNYATTYAADFSTFIAVATTAYNTAMKGSGSAMGPKFMISGPTPHAGYESKLTVNQRFVDSSEADGGFKVLAFKSLRYVFSHAGDDKVYFLSGRSFKLYVFKSAYRLLGDTAEFPQTNGFIRKIFTLAQCGTNNKSRLAVIYSA